MYNIIRKEYITMYECPKDCLSCANSFSEQGDEMGMFYIVWNTMK